MGSPVSERGAWIHAFERATGGAYSGVWSETIDMHFIAADVSMHVGLSRTVWTRSDRAAHAAVGIVGFSPVGGPAVDFGPSSWDWPPMLYARTGFVTWAWEVAAAEMTCWMFMQVWR